MMKNRVKILNVWLFIISVIVIITFSLFHVFASFNLSYVANNIYTFIYEFPLVWILSFPVFMIASMKKINKWIKLLLHIIHFFFVSIYFVYYYDKYPLGILFSLIPYIFFTIIFYFINYTEKRKLRLYITFFVLIFLFFLFEILVMSPLSWGSILVI